LPLLERVRVEVYLPDSSVVEYNNLLRSYEAEFTYAFGGCTIMRGLEGCYLSQFGNRIHDRINVIYSDVPLALSIESAVVAGYVGEVKRAATEALAEEVVMIVVTQIYHSV
jgi:hypothetical protein